MSHSNSISNQSINLDTYPSTGFAGDNAAAHAHRAAKIISEYLQLNPTAKTTLQEFIKKVLYYKPYNFDDLCTAVAVMQKFAQSPRFLHFAEHMELGIGTGAARLNNMNQFPLLLFSGAYSVAEGLNSNSNADCPLNYVSKLVLDARAFTRQEICAMIEDFNGWFDWKLEIYCAEINSIKTALTS